ncbi:MAG: hydroxymethylglutaryl-CoA lyase, partial [Spirochaetota bacterium]
ASNPALPIGFGVWLCANSCPCYLLGLLHYHKVAVFTSPSDAFNLKNTNRTTTDSLQACLEICKQAEKDAIQVRAYISTVVACPYQGAIQAEQVLQVCEPLLEAGVYEISLGETIGVAVPQEIEVLLQNLLKRFSAKLFASHFHDTYGMAIANVYKSLEMGIRSFDSSIAGLGGCPYAPGAAGNLATEDLIYLLEKLGFATGIDWKKLLQASEFILHTLAKKPISKVSIALAGKKDRR